MKLPQQIEEFAQKYFAAQARAEVHSNHGLIFRTIDKKNLARDCKVLLDSGVVENLWQLTADLTRFDSSYAPGTHGNRLRNFAALVGIKFPNGNRATAVAPASVVHRTPAHGFDIRVELGNSFSKALVSGMPLSTIQAHAKEVLVDCHNKVQVGKATDALQELMRNTGMSASQIAQLAQAL